MNKAPSLVRKLYHEPVLVEGWAHYCEELMALKGFTDKPQALFMFAKDAAWRAARVIIDISLHTGKMSVEEAVKFLVESTGMTEEGARREVKRYTLTPGQPLSYLIGKEAIKAMRRRLERRLGARFDEKAFHDALVQAGGVSLPHLEKLIAKSLVGKGPRIP